MIDAADFMGSALERGYTFWTGVPCSLLTPLINFVIDSGDLDYFAATNEGESVGIAAGAHLAGRKTVVMCQNSGLGNMVNSLTSLNYPFHIPTLLVITHRGAPGMKDEPQHAVMGRITGEILTSMGIPWEQFPDRHEDIDAALGRADEYMSGSSLPYAFIMAKASVAVHPLKPQAARAASELPAPVGSFVKRKQDRMGRQEAIQVIHDVVGGEAAIVATTGHIGRELFALGHRENQIYIVGSMGCASSVGFGVHQGTQGRRPVVVLDGDGAALMKMGTFATIGHYRPARLTHVVLDNEAHGSTGGQATVSSTTDFATVASGCGYRHTWRIEDRQDLSCKVGQAMAAEGPNLFHVKVALGSDPNLGRPTLPPIEVKDQFKQWLS